MAKSAKKPVLKTIKKKAIKTTAKPQVQQTNYAAYYQTSIGKLLVLLLGVILAYVFASLAIDSGSLWHYLIAFIFIYFAIKATVDLVKPKSK